MKIVTAASLNAQNGIKCLVYGPPGTAKSPLSSTAPRPLFFALETGTRSLDPRQPVVECHDFARIEDVVHALKSGSRELSAYDTLCFDSLSQMAEIYLTHYKKVCKDGRKAYGMMGEKMREIVDGLKTYPQKHVYMICKLGMRQAAETGRNVPSFPGKDLETYVPHELDFIWYISHRQVPGLQGEQLALQTHNTIETMARSRISIHSPVQLDFLEPPHLGALFSKLTQ